MLVTDRFSFLFPSLPLVTSDPWLLSILVKLAAACHEVRQRCRRGGNHLLLVQADCCCLLLVLNDHGLWQRGYCRLWHRLACYPHHLLAVLVPLIMLDTLAA